MKKNNMDLVRQSARDRTDEKEQYGSCETIDKGQNG